MSKNSASLLCVQFAYSKDKGKLRNKKLFSLVDYRVSTNDKKNLMFRCSWDRYASLYTTAIKMNIFWPNIIIQIQYMYCMKKREIENYVQMEETMERK